MIRLALVTVRHRWWAFAGTFAGTALAVALVAACGTLLFSALSAPAGADRYASADAVVSAQRQVTVRDGDKSKTRPLPGAPALPDGLEGRLASVPGVAQVTKDVSFYAQPLSADGDPVGGEGGAPVMGHAWSSAALTPFRLTAGHAPGTGDVVLDEGLARQASVRPGDQVRLALSEKVTAFQVAGIATAQDGPQLASQGAVFFSHRDAARLARPGDSAALALRFTPGADSGRVLGAVRSAAGPRLRVLTGDERVQADAPAVLVSYTGAVGVFGSMAGITVFAALFVIAGTIAFAARQRLRELALLRTLGATPRQVRRLLGLEAWAVGLAAAVAGAPLGLWSAGWLGKGFVDTGAVPASLEVRGGVLPLLIAAGAGLVVARLAAFFAGRRAARIAPAEAMRESAAAPAGGGLVRLVLGAILVAGAVAVLVFTPMRGGIGVGMGFIACALLICGAAAVGPWVVRVVCTVLAGLLPGTAGRLAAANARRFPLRAAGAALPLALMFALNATMLLNSTLLADLTSRAHTDRVAPARQTLTAPGSPGLPLDAYRAAARMPGITDVDATLPMEVMVRKGGKPQHYPAQGLYRAGRGVLDLEVTQGSLSKLGEGVAVSTDLAAGQHWQVGDTASLWLPDGTRVAKPVVALYARSAGFGEILLPGRVAAVHTARPVLSAVHLGQTPSKASLSAARAQFPQLAWGSGGATEREDAEAASQEAALQLLTGISVAFTAVAVLNTFAMAALSRRGEYAGLRLLGATARQVRAIAAREAMLTVGAGLFIGVAIAAAVVGTFSAAQDGQWRVIVSPGWYAGMLTGTVLLGLAAAALPTRLVLRTADTPQAGRKE
ncbi:FtsX-like permease family protein [Streptomyces rubradiris]|uniref:ABC transporter permease n=1 Tax=Streptomyces rubradiris TaxID=285531 RepID=A0ABQ3R4H3_STRRR|nr:FtsX-like permease family protein [Streptomyces rubradiris]GHH06045.1 ABC transporter permease [Streptomyces rubradiris]GHI50756.1 ABC transporter permease [Streptomyces rubradiris]